MKTRQLIAMAVVLALVGLALPVSAEAAPRFASADVWTPGAELLEMVFDWAHSLVQFISSPFVSQEGAAMGGSG